MGFLWMYHMIPVFEPSLRTNERNPPPPPQKKKKKKTLEIINTDF